MRTLLGEFKPLFVICRLFGHLWLTEGSIEISRRKCLCCGASAGWQTFSEKLRRFGPMPAPPPRPQKVAA